MAIDDPDEATISLIMGVGDGLGQVARRAVILKGNDAPESGIAAAFDMLLDDPFGPPPFFFERSFMPFALALSAPTEFSDLPTGHWAHAAIFNLVEHDAITGFYDGTFRPNQLATIEQFISLVVRVANVDLPVISSPVYWSDAYIQYAIEKGLLLPSANINEEITREFAFFLLYRILGSGDSNIWNRLQHATPQTTADMQFYDMDEINDAYRGAIQALFQHGIVGGHASGEVRPLGNLTRAEMAVLLFRALTPSGNLVSIWLDPYHPNLTASFEDVLAGLTNASINTHGVQAFRFIAHEEQYYIFSASNGFMPLVFSVVEDGDETRFYPMYGLLERLNDEHGTVQIHHRLEAGQRVIITVMGAARHYFTLIIGDEYFRLAQDIEWRVFTHYETDTEIFITAEKIPNFGPYENVMLGITRLLGSPYGNIYILNHGGWNLLGTIRLAGIGIARARAGFSSSILSPNLENVIRDSISDVQDIVDNPFMEAYLGGFVWDTVLELMNNAISFDECIEQSFHVMSSIIGLRAWAEITEEQIEMFMGFLEEEENELGFIPFSTNEGISVDPFNIIPDIPGYEATERITNALSRNDGVGASLTTRAMLITLNAQREAVQLIMDDEWYYAHLDAHGNPIPKPSGALQRMAYRHFVWNYWLTISVGEKAARIITTNREWAEIVSATHQATYNRLISDGVRSRNATAQANAHVANIRDIWVDYLKDAGFNAFYAFVLNFPSFQNHSHRNYIGRGFTIMCIMDFWNNEAGRQYAIRYPRWEWTSNTLPDRLNTETPPGLVEARAHELHVFQQATLNGDVMYRRTQFWYGNPSSPHIYPYAVLRKVYENGWWHTNH